MRTGDGAWTRDPYRLYLLISGASALFLWLAFSVNLVFQVERVGLSPLELVLVGTVLEGTYFLFEIPTGVVADVYSRRLSVIVGTALLGAGLFVVAVPSFPVILLGNVVMGIGYTFISGALGAWIVDEIRNSLEPGQEYAAWLEGNRNLMERLPSQIQGQLTNEMGAVLPQVSAKYREMVIGWASDPRNLIAVAGLLRGVLG